jgi:hypothetical protein
VRERTIRRVDRHIAEGIESQFDRAHSRTGVVDCTL